MKDDIEEQLKTQSSSISNTLHEAQTTIRNLRYALHLIGYDYV